MTPINKKILTKDDWDRQDRLTQAISVFAFEILQLKKQKVEVIDGLTKRGKELQICCRKIAKAGGKATQAGDEKIYVVKGSFAPEIFNPEIGNFTIEKSKTEPSKGMALNPALADELDKIYKLTFGYFGTKLTQLASQFEIICKRFWMLDQTQEKKGKKE